MNVIDLATKTLQLATQTVVGEVKSVVDSTSTKVDTLDDKVNTLVNERVVKSVQRGTVTPVNTSTTISISAVNPSKCAVLLNSNNTNLATALTGLSATSMVLSHTSNSNVVSWQVIEFY